MKVNHIRKTVVDKELVSRWISSDDAKECEIGFTLAKGRADINPCDNLHILEKWLERKIDASGHSLKNIIYRITQTFDGVRSLSDSDDDHESLKRLKWFLSHSDRIYNIFGFNAAKKCFIPEEVLEEWLFDYSLAPFNRATKNRFDAAAIHKISNTHDINTIYEVLEKCPKSSILIILKYCNIMHVFIPIPCIEEVALKWGTVAPLTLKTQILITLGQLYNYSMNHTPSVFGLRALEDYRSFNPPEVVFRGCLGNSIAQIFISRNSYIRGTEHIGGRASRVVIGRIDNKLYGEPIAIPLYDEGIGYFSTGDEIEILDFDLSNDLYGTGFMFSNTIRQARTGLPEAMSPYQNYVHDLMNYHLLEW